MLGFGLGLVGSELGLVLGLFSALLYMFRTRSPMFDTLRCRNNSHGLKEKRFVFSASPRSFSITWPTVCRCQLWAEGGEVVSPKGQRSGFT